MVFRMAGQQVLSARPTSFMGRDRSISEDRS